MLSFGCEVDWFILTITLLLHFFRVFKTAVANIPTTLKGIYVTTTIGEAKNH